MSDLNRAHIQKYDGKKEMYDKFEAQVLEFVVILGCEDALGKNLRHTCPTDTVYAGFDLANTGNDVERRSTRSARSKKMCSLLTLAQRGSHGLAMINKTKDQRD